MTHSECHKVQTITNIKLHSAFNQTEGKNAIVNIQNTVQIRNVFYEQSYQTCIQRGRHLQRVSKYIQYGEEFDFSGIEFQLQMNDVSKFENQNEISVNVFGHEKGKVYP